MALQSNDGKLNEVDVAIAPNGMGTVGGPHVATSSLRGGNINQIIMPFDPRIQYFGGTGAGSWQISTNAVGLWRYSTYAQCNTPGAQIAVSFTGTSIAVFGLIAPSGGKFDAYIDGVSYNGLSLTETFIPAIIPFGQQIPPGPNQISPLNSTTTTITLLTPMISDAGFPSTGGIIRIEKEQILYTSHDGTSFLGCTRGYNGTTAATHQEGMPIYLLNSTIDTYSALVGYRRKLWAADDLPPGGHTLILQIRTDKNVSATNTRLFIDSFAIGSSLGGSTLNLATQQVSLGASITTDGTGKWLIGALSDSNSSRQLVSILGITDDSKSLTYQLDTDGNIWVHGAASTTYTNIIMTLLYAEPTI